MICSGGGGCGAFSASSLGRGTFIPNPTADTSNIACALAPHAAYEVAFWCIQAERMCAMQLSRSALVMLTVKIQPAKVLANSCRTQVGAHSDGR